MTEGDSAGAKSTLTPSQLERIDGVCDRFEDACNAGLTPRIEDFLRDVTQDEYSACLRELLLIELSYRNRGGNVLQATAYEARFPNHVKIIHEAFQIRTAKDGDPQKETSNLTSVFSLLEDYEPLREIGRGGMGVVYLARQVSLGREVAVKIMPPALLADQHKLRSFKREIETLGGLKHPGIVSVIDAGEVAGYPFLVMEHVPSVSLGRALTVLANRPAQEVTLSDFYDALGLELVNDPATQKALNVLHPNSTASRLGYIEVVLRMFVDLCTALAYAHAKRVVHRDIKPHNILVDRLGNPKLVDFGLARTMGADKSLHSANLAGTPVFMSPEQILAGRVTLDHRSDIYSLGATLYQTLTLHPPFQGKDHYELFRRIQWDDPVAMRRLNPLVSRDLETVVATSMAKNPDKRYADVRSFRDDLQRILNYDAVKARSVSRLSRVIRRLRKHRFAALAIIVTSVVLLVLACGALTMRRTGNVRSRAIRQQESLRIHNLIGRTEEAIKADLPEVAFAELAAAEPLDKVPNKLRQELFDLKSQAKTLVNNRLETTKDLLDQGRLVEASDLLTTIQNTPYRNDEIAQLISKTNSDMRKRRDTSLFNSESREYRLIAVRAFHEDRMGGAMSKAREEAFESLLQTEKDITVLGAALAPMSAAEFGRYEFMLKNRFDRSPPEIALCLVTAAAAHNAKSWLPGYQERKRELLAAGQALEIDDMSDSDLFYRVSWDQDYNIDGYASSASRLSPSSRENVAFSVLISGFVLGSPDTMSDAKWLLNQRSTCNPALKILREFDDPSAGDYVFEAWQSGVFSTWETMTACRMLARWRHEAAATILRSLIDNDRFLRNMPYTIRTVVAELYASKDIQLSIRYLNDSTVSDDLRRAIYLGLRGTWIGRGRALDMHHSEWPNRPDHLFWLGRERDRQRILAETRDALKTNPASAWAAELSWDLDLKSSGLRSPDGPSRHPPQSIDALTREQLMKEALLSIEHPILPMRRLAALSLVEYGRGKTALGVLQECRRLYGPEPEVERAIARIELERGDRAAATKRLQAIYKNWYVPDTFLDDVHFDEIRHQVQPDKEREP